jgi:hypothetical protein
VKNENFRIWEQILVLIPPKLLKKAAFPERDRKGTHFSTQLKAHAIKSFKI